MNVMCHTFAKHIVLYSLPRPVKHSKDKGASSWLLAVPLAGHGIALHKGCFVYAVHLRYELQTPFCN